MARPVHRVEKLRIWRAHNSICKLGKLVGIDPLLARLLVAVAGLELKFNLFIVPELSLFSSLAPVHWSSLNIFIPLEASKIIRFNLDERERERKRKEVDVEGQENKLAPTLYCRARFEREAQVDCWRFSLRPLANHTGIWNATTVTSSTTSAISSKMNETPTTSLKLSLLK